MPLNPNYNQTLTIFHRNEAKVWEKKIVEQCFFRKGCTTTVDAAGRESLRDTATARIPDLDVVVAKGDLIIRGEIPERITDQSPYTAAELLDKYEADAFRVAGVSDNRASFIGRHVKVAG